MTKKIERRLEELDALGFDDSMHIKGDHIWLKCSQCEAMSINGIPTHEHGCPNAMHECHGCNEIIPMNQRYCSDCQ